MKNIALLLAAIFSGLYATSANAQKAPIGWHLTGSEQFGANVEKAVERLKNKTPGKITVALIDTGIDIDHKELQGKFWINPGEIPGNGIDDDRNGYVDDVNGWNFLGTAAGTFDLTSAGTEAFREYKRLRPAYKDVKNADGLDEAQKKEYAHYKRMESEAKLSAYLMFTSHLANIAAAFLVTDSLVLAQYPGQEFTVGGLGTLKVDPKDERTATAVQIASAQCLALEDNAPWKTAFDENISKFKLAAERVASLDDPATDPRLKMGDDLSDFTNLRYGNNHTGLHDGGEGTVHASLIAAAGNNDIGFIGVFPQAEIMIVRAYPEGEEYDKDVAASIRYAVDNGAKVIGMPFCKTLSPYAAEVTKAIEYAAAKDVLIVRPAGDMKLDTDKTPIYPAAFDVKGMRFPHMVVVGASTADGNAAPFSNYGARSVDLFAPGRDVAAAVPNDEYMRFEGSSLSAAVVAGVAAMLRSYFPGLSAKEVRDILIASAHSMSGRMTSLPGKPSETIDFSKLSVSGGIVDADKAVEMLLQK